MLCAITSLVIELMRGSLYDDDYYERGDVIVPASDGTGAL